MDEDTPHMHLIFIPVVHTTDKQGHKIDKVCCRDFWKGKNSYRDLQNSYFKHNQKVIDKLEKENNYLKKIIYKFKITVQKFISWVCHKFSAPSEEALIRDFERETYMDFDFEKQIDINKFDKEQQEEELEY